MLATVEKSSGQKSSEQKLSAMVEEALYVVEEVDLDASMSWVFGDNNEYMLDLHEHPVINEILNIQHVLNKVTVKDLSNLGGQTTFENLRLYVQGKSRGISVVPQLKLKY